MTHAKITTLLLAKFSLVYYCFLTKTSSQDQVQGFSRVIDGCANRDLTNASCIAGAQSGFHYWALLPTNNNKKCLTIADTFTANLNDVTDEVNLSFVWEHSIFRRYVRFSYRGPLTVYIDNFKSPDNTFNCMNGDLNSTTITEEDCPNSRLDYFLCGNNTVVKFGTDMAFYLEQAGGCPFSSIVGAACQCLDICRTMGYDSYDCLDLYEAVLYYETDENTYDETDYSSLSAFSDYLVVIDYFPIPNRTSSGRSHNELIIFAIKMNS